MTRITWGAAALLLATTSVAQAGALDRTLQPVSVIFEDGNYAQLSFGFTSPDVGGVIPGAGLESGNVGVDFSTATLSFKYDISERLSVGVVVDQPFGADISYGESDLGYPIEGSEATFDSSSVTVLGRYKLNDNFSVHTGARLITIDADLFVAVPSLAYSYDADFGEDSDAAYVLGAAYERPDIALRVALTYSSETSFSNESSYEAVNFGVPGSGDGPVEYTLPQSVNLDVRTGIAANTALFGQIRWADWSETEINVPDYLFNPVVEYEEDVFTYTLGVGRKFTDRISAAASVIYESQSSDDFDPLDPDSGVSNLSPTDGQIGFEVGGTYVVGNGLELTGGVRYTRLGDATTRTFGAEFEDNSAVSLGLRVGYRF
jgi:long-subunit fatty acid transport protein